MGLFVLREDNQPNNPQFTNGQYKQGIMVKHP